MFFYSKPCDRDARIGSQQMLEVMSLHMDTGLKSLPPLINGLINDGLPKL